MKVPFLDFVAPYEELKAGWMRLISASCAPPGMSWAVRWRRLNRNLPNIAGRTIASASGMAWKRCI